MAKTPAQPEAYRTVAGLFNLSVVPELPRLVRTFEQRRALFRTANPSYKHGRGTARRWKRELNVRDTLEWRRRLLAGERVMVGHLRLRRSWRELVHERLRESTAAISATRAHARTLMGQLVEHGPWNGWGVRQPERSGPGAPWWTPYEVPKASERCWRWWRQLARELARVLLHLDALLWRAVPLHRAPGELPPRGEMRSSAPPSPREDGTRCRDRSPEGVGAILGTLMPGRAM
jgi:hypothetical protein